MLRRFAGLLILLLGVVGLVACLAGIFGIWKVRPMLTARSEEFGSRADQLLGVAEKSLRQVSRLLAHARKDLDEVAEVAMKSSAPGAEVNPLEKFLMERVAKEYRPRLDMADSTLNVTLNAAVILKTLLDGMGEVPALQFTDVDADRLQEASGQLSGLIDSAVELRSKLQQMDVKPDVLQLQQDEDFKRTLTEVTERTDELADRIAEVHDRVKHVRTELPRWLTLVAIALTTLLAWVGLGQLCLAVRGATWLFGHVRPDV